MMVLGSPDHIVYNGKSFMQPFVRYIVPNELGNECLKSNAKWKVSAIGSFERRYGGQDLNGKSIAIIRYHGIGDMLMVTGLVKYLHDKYPEAIIHFYCLDSYASSVWHQNEDLTSKGYIPLPMTLDGMRQYDYHLFYDGMIEHNAEYDQNNAYDDMFAFAGLHDVPDQYKHPYIYESDKDAEWAKAEGIVLDEPYILVQIHSSSDIRTYPPEQTAEMLKLCLKRFPEHKIILVGEVMHDVIKEVSDNRIISAVGKMNAWRSMIPLVKNANAIVCPDSSISHIAAVFPEVPVVSLWGAFSFASRAKYYTNHHPIEVKVCPHQPCWTHGMTIPKDKCKDCESFSNGEKYCSGMRAITPESIVEKLEVVM